MSARTKKRKRKTTGNGSAPARVAVNNSAAAGAAEEESQRFSKPLASLLMWIGIWGDVPVDALCKIKDADYARFEQLQRDYPELTDELRQLCILGSILNRRQTAGLMPCRLGRVR